MKNRDSHLPDGALSEPHVVGDGEQGGRSDKVPGPRLVLLDQRLPTTHANLYVSLVVRAPNIAI